MLLFKIGGIQKTTLLDYPEKIACIVFTVGCNFRCGYCHNPELFVADSSKMINPNDFFSYLNGRRGKLDGVVITGGEPTLQMELIDFIKKIKEMGFLVKLDTNGTNPKIIKELLGDNLIDYIAMDIKAPLGKYNEITRVKCDLGKIKESIDLIIKSEIESEFRTTVVKSQLNENDFIEIGELIKGAKNYYLQKFEPSKILDESLMNEKSYSDVEFEGIIEKIKGYINHIELR